MSEELSFNQLVPSSLQRLVAVENTPGGVAVCFLREKDGALTSTCLPFRPWLLVDSPSLTELISVPHQDIPLEGPGRYTLRVTFDNTKDYEEALKELKKKSGFNPSSPNSPYRVFSDLTQQFLSVAPARLFAEMTFPELRRMQLDIETNCEGNDHFPEARREGDYISLIAIKDSTGFEKCLVNQGDEKRLLEEMVSLIQERDPDVIEGHNIFNFDLPYIKERCARHKVKLAIGRDGSVPKTRASRFTCGERIIPYTRFEIFGRHIIDTYHLVQLYDISHRDMESHGLKAAAKYFHVAREGRVYVPGDEISRTFQEDSARLQEYCLDDVRETDAISRILSPSYFYQSCLIPLSYQNMVVRGNATRIDALLCAEYLRGNGAIPLPAMPLPLEGALTEGERQGVYQKIWHVDVRSLYPSIIAARKLTPTSDARGIFLKLLCNLRQFRLQAKDAMRHAENAEQKAHFNALQSTFKILINSFYGYTGFPMGTFNDFRMASEITATGRMILQGMKNFLELSGALVIEMDTDGIYFKPPEHFPDGSEPTPDTMLEKIQNTLPPGIEVEMDAIYQAMYGYKAKNYALLKEDGTIVTTGAALKSRGLEPFQRRFIQDSLRLLLTGRKEELPALRNSYAEAIQNHTFPLQDFARKEYLTTDPRTYAEKVSTGAAKRSAPYELALNSSQTYKSGDQVEFYVIGEKKSIQVIGNARLLADNQDNTRDENVAYYLAKLDALAEKLQ